jgi:hypothetical protein
MNEYLEKDQQVLWVRYEQAVSDLLSALDPNADVKHNARIIGRLSTVKRQVDVFAQGRIVGQDIVVAVECKRHKRIVGIEMIDQFVGKLLDLGAERGVLYAYSGFSEAATRRAIGASNPRVLAVALQETPPSIRELRGVPGYPADDSLTAQWFDELEVDSYARFLEQGDWSKWWS